MYKRVVEEVTKGIYKIVLAEYLIKKYNIKYIKRHKDVGDTECPGKSFFLEKLKRG